MTTQFEAGIAWKHGKLTGLRIPDPPVGTMRRRPAEFVAPGLTVEGAKLRKVSHYMSELPDLLTWISEHYGMTETKRAELQSSLFRLHNQVKHYMRTVDEDSEVPPATPITKKPKRRR